MMEFLKSLLDIPLVFRLHTLHPALVHYPIALWVVGFFFYLYARMKSSKPAELIAVANLITGTLLSFAAAFAGKLAADRLVFAPKIHELMEIHEKVGWSACGFFTLLSLWGFFTYKRAASKVIPLFLLLYVIGLGVLGLQSYIGGYMVYEGGVGVSQKQATVQPLTPQGARSVQSEKNH